LAVVVVLSAHLSVLGDALLPCLAANDGPTHRARNETAECHQDGSGENDVGAPCHVRDEEEDIDEKAEQAC